MPKFIVTPENVKEGYVEIKDEDAFHITKVLRMKKGDKIFVSDGRADYHVLLCNLNSNCVVGKIENTKERMDTQVDITMLQSIPKSQKMDWIVQKATELGIKKIVPVMTERTIVKLDTQKAEKKRRRWQRIAKEAAKQSGRSTIPLIEGVLSFEEALRKGRDADLAIIPWEEEQAAGLKDLIKGKTYKKIIFCIGPEGGFSRQEVERAKENSFKPVTFGPKILRTETAGIFLLSVLMYELGDMGGSL
jgi:16S rRNA (uracil1498-N3)-methyltransferase